MTKPGTSRITITLTSEQRAILDQALKGTRDDIQQFITRHAMRAADRLSRRVDLYEGRDQTAPRTESAGVLKSDSPEPTFEVMPGGKWVMTIPVPEGWTWMRKRKKSA